MVRASTSASPRVAVVGLGYVGLPLLAELTLAGVDAVGHDVSEQRVSAIRAGDVEVPERYRGVLSDLQVSWGLNVLDDVEGAFICVPTERNEPLAKVRAALEKVRTYAEGLKWVAVESTVPVGSCDALAEEFDLDVIMAPERLDPYVHGSLAGVPKLLGPSRECSDESFAAVYRLYAEYTKVTRVSSARVAEAAKLFENTYRAVNIALANELSDLCCNQYEIDPVAVLDAASTKPFGFARFDPGPGVGGHCIPVDPWFWKANSGGVINTALHANALRPLRLAALLRGRDLDRPTTLLVGAGYKSYAADTRNSPIRVLLNQLENVRWTDPNPKVTRESLGEAAARYRPWRDTIVCDWDAVVLLTSQEAEIWPPRAKCIIDTRGCLPKWPHVIRA